MAKLTIRISKKEEADLARRAKQRGLTVNALVRGMIKEEADRHPASVLPRARRAAKRGESANDDPFDGDDSRCMIGHHFLSFASPKYLRAVARREKEAARRSGRKKTAR